MSFGISFPGLTDTSVVLCNVSVPGSTTVQLASSSVGKYLFCDGSGTIVLPNTTIPGAYLVFHNSGADAIDISGVLTQLQPASTLSFVYNNAWINM